MSKLNTAEFVHVEKLKPFIAREESKEESRELYEIHPARDGESQPLMFSHGDVVWLISGSRNQKALHRDGPFEVLLKSSRNGKYHIKELRQTKHRSTHKLRDYRNVPASKLQLCIQER